MVRKLSVLEGFAQAVELISSNRVDVTINDKLSFLDYKKKSLMHQSKLLHEKSDRCCKVALCLEKTATHLWMK